jgi:DNA-binding MarR family transcriptional regulator
MKPSLDDSVLRGLLGYTVAKADVALRRAFQPMAAQLEIRPAEYSALRVIAVNQDVSPGPLAKTLAVSAPNLAVMLERLESRGLISRAQRAEDRRGHQIALTNKGRALVKKGAQLEVEAEQFVTRRLSPAERALLLELLERLVK